MEALQVRFKYTQNEYVRAERQYLIANRTVRKYDGILVAVFLLFSIGFLFLSSFSTFSIILMGVLLIVTILECYLYFLMPVLKFKRTAKYHEEYLLEFSKDMIQFKTPSIETQLKWDIYREVWESNDFYFIIQAPHMYATIPKRAFKSQKEMNLFLELAQLNLKIVKNIG